MTLERDNCMCEKKQRLHNDSLGLSRLHKSAIADFPLCLVSTPKLLTDTCRQSKGWLTSLLHSFSIKPDLHHTRTLRGGGGSSKTRISITAQQEGEGERMKGCEGMQLFKQLFDLAVTAPRVSHSGSSSVEITQTFIPLVRQFFSALRCVCVCVCVWNYSVVCTSTWWLVHAV